MANGHGGKRAGAGKKFGKPTFDTLSLMNKRAKIIGMIDERDIEQIIRFLIQRAKTNTSTAKYVINQLIGRPLQATDITSGGERIESFNDEQVSRIAKRVASGSTISGSPSGS